MTTQHLGGIEWDKVRNIQDVLALPPHVLYDDADMKLPSDWLHLRPNLTQEEIEDAMWWRQFLFGQMLVTGDMGGGKGIFMHMLGFKMHYYFDKRTVSDTRPREAYGAYVPFSTDMLIEQVARMEEVATGMPRPYLIKGRVKSDFPDKEGWKEYRELSVEEKFEDIKSAGMVPERCTFKSYDDRKNVFTVVPDFIPHVDKVTGKWESSRGEVFFQNAVLLLDEYASKYMPKARANLSISQALLSLSDYLRHLSCLILGVGVDMEDFNPRSIEKAYWQARCERCDNRRWQFSNNPEDIIIKVTMFRVNSFKNGVVVKEIMARLFINASEPKQCLGGLRWIDIFHSANAQGIALPKALLKRG